MIFRAVFVYQDAKNIVLGAKGEDGFTGALAHFHEDSRAYAVRTIDILLAFYRDQKAKALRRLFWSFAALNDADHPSIMCIIDCA